MHQKLMITGLGILLMSAMSFAQPQTASAEPVAMITDLQGQAKLTKGSNSTQAEILSSLYPGNQVSLEKDTELVLVYYSNGKEYHFAGPATVEIGENKPNVLTGKAASIRDLKLIKEIRLNSDKGHLNQAVILLRGGINNRNKIKLLSPVNSKLLNTHPNFRWEDFKNSTQYRFTLIDDEGRSMLETLVNSNYFKLPDSIQLQQGMLYSWQLEARLDTGAVYVSSSSFQIVPEIIQKKMNRLRPEVDASFSELLVYAQFLEQQGFTEDARNYWRILSKQRPRAAELQKLAK